MQKIAPIPSVLLKVTQHLLRCYFMVNSNLYVRDNHVSGFISKALVEGLKKSWFCTEFTNGITPIKDSVHYCTILNDIYSTNKYLKIIIRKYMEKHRNSKAMRFALEYKSSKQLYELLVKLYGDELGFEFKKTLWTQCAPVHKEIFIIPFDKKTDDESINHILSVMTPDSIVAVGSFASAEWLKSDIKLSTDALIAAYKKRASAQGHKYMMPEDASYVKNKISNFDIKRVSDFVKEDVVSSYGYPGEQDSQELMQVLRNAGAYGICEGNIATLPKAAGIEIAASYEQPVTRLFKFTQLYMGKGEYSEIANGVAVGMDNFSAEVQYLKLENQRKSWRSRASLSNHDYSELDLDRIKSYSNAIQNWDGKWRLMSNHPINCPVCCNIFNLTDWYCPVCGTENEDNPENGGNPEWLQEESKLDMEKLPYDLDYDNPEQYYDIVNQQIDEIEDKKLNVDE